jgi:hypothetical protein
MAETEGLGAKPDQPGPAKQDAPKC